MARIFRLAFATVLFAAAGTALAASDALKVTKLIVDPELAAGVGYDVAFQFEQTAPFEVRQVCFLWSGEGPFCWKSHAVDEASSQIRTVAITRNPGKYKLTGYVEYEAGGEKKKTNRVSAQIQVKPLS